LCFEGDRLPRDPGRDGPRRLVLRREVCSENEFWGRENAEPVHETRFRIDDRRALRRKSLRVTRRVVHTRFVGRPGYRV